MEGESSNGVDVREKKVLEMLLTPMCPLQGAY